MKLILSCILTIFSLVNLTMAEKPEQAKVSTELTSVIKSLYNGNFEVLHKHTHPNIILMVEGKENYHNLFKRIVAYFKQAGISFESAKISEIKGYVANETTECFYVDVLLTLKSGERVEPTQTIQMGIKNLDAKDWAYVDLTDKTLAQIKAMIPNIPEKFVMPKQPKKEEPEE